MALGSEYAELLLLRRIGYQGKYLPRSNTTLMNSSPLDEVSESIYGS
jgi:hypothetical protein